MSGGGARVAPLQVYALAWQRRHMRLVRAARAVDAKHNAASATYSLQRAQGWMALTLRRKHDTFAALMAPPTEGLLRWQRVFILFISILAMLTTNIWFFYSKARGPDQIGSDRIELYHSRPASFSPTVY